MSTQHTNPTRISSGNAVASSSRQTSAENSSNTTSGSDTTAENPEATRREMIAYSILGFIAMVALVLFVKVGTVEAAIAGTAIIFLSRPLVVRALAGRPQPLPSMDRTIVIIGPSNDQNLNLGKKLSQLYKETNIVICLNQQQPQQQHQQKQHQQKPARIVETHSDTNDFKDPSSNGNRFFKIMVDTENLKDLIGELKEISKENGVWSVLNLALPGPGFDCLLADVDITRETTYDETLEALNRNIRLVKVLLPSLRLSNGRMITIQPHQARLASPFCSTLNIFQAGLAAFHASIRVELKRFHVQYSLIECPLGVCVDPAWVEKYKGRIRRNDGNSAENSHRLLSDNYNNRESVPAVNTKNHKSTSSSNNSSGAKRINNSEQNMTTSETNKDISISRINDIHRQTKNNTSSETTKATSTDTSSSRRPTVDEDTPTMVLEDYGEEYIEYMEARWVETVDVSHSKLLVAVQQALWSCAPSSRYSVSCSSRDTSFLQRRPGLAQILPDWFIDQILMFDYKDSPLPLAAPDPVDDDD